MKTTKLTVAQALVRFLDNQYLEVDGRTIKFVKGIFAIFGHGNVLGLGQALEEDCGELAVYQGRNEQGMAHAAIGFAKQQLRQQIIACTSSVGPGAANMITAATTATANRIPLLLLPGDVFATRQPDPVLQQIEQPHDLSISTNDAFRPVSKYWDRVSRPEQLMSACINAMRVLTDPAETGAVTLCLPQDVQGEAWDYPDYFFARRVHRLVHNILPEDRPADSLLVVEVYTDEGDTSSYPSHKHDTPVAGKETYLEETYYHRFDPPQGFALQRVYTDDRSLDEAMAVYDRDVVKVPRGYHPVATIAGYNNYYLNVMAGPERKWLFSWEADHLWVNSDNYPAPSL